MPSYLAPIAKPLIYLMSKLAREPQYAPGHKAYYAKPFADNPLTQSAARYHWFRDLYEEMPQLKLGGPSTTGCGKVSMRSKISMRMQKIFHCLF